MMSAPSPPFGPPALDRQWAAINLAILSTSFDVEDLVRLKAMPTGTVVGEKRGFRAWRLCRVDGAMRLRSLVIKECVWDGPVMNGESYDGTASLATEFTRGGYYAFKDVARMAYELGQTPAKIAPILFGRVELWGAMVEHEYGYRAECCRVRTLDWFRDRRQSQRGIRRLRLLNRREPHDALEELREFYLRGIV